ncbi:MAG: hypothetical protein JW731_02465 [Bacteroidales bacterium]|nr:hypothetical protein [Bacteroidales bacterium]
MKTLKFLIFTIGIILCQLGYSFTTVNLPVEGVYENPVDNLFVSTSLDNILPAEISEINEIVTPNNEDTIIIDLDEVVITDGFPQAAEQCIIQQIKYPDFALKDQLEGMVALSLVFDDYGKIHVMEVYSSNPEFEKYVIQKLAVLHLKNCCVKVGQPYNIKFTFKLY